MISHLNMFLLLSAILFLFVHVRWGAISLTDLAIKTGLLLMALWAIFEWLLLSGYLIKVS